MIGTLLQLVGSLLLSYAVLARGASLNAAAAPYTAACAGCPATASLDSVRVQDREGSTLFAIGGRMPASVGDLPADVRLEANDVEVVLRPDAEGFRIVSATKGGAALAADAIAAGIADGHLLIDLRDQALSAPVLFAVGFVRDGAPQGRLPAQGRLLWSGSGPPTVAVAAASARPAPTVAPTAVATAAPTAVPAVTLPPAVDVTAYADGCRAFDGTAPGYLAVTQVRAGSGPDPRTNLATRFVGATLAGPVPDDGAARAPFSITAVIDRAGQTTGRGARLIDTVGNVQLWAQWDGRALQKGIRTWTGSAWGNRTNAAAEPLTVALTRTGLLFYWEGLRAGDRVGIVTAASGCLRSAFTETVP